jgi:hypothetical protein
MRQLIPLTALIAALLAVPGPAAAATENLWSTVNVCDTAKQPNKMGVRARMPGNGRRGRMFMRFTAQFRDADGWGRVEGQGRSGWLPAGRSIFRYRELGFTFSFGAPPAGRSYLMRGLVEFQWRNRKDRVVARARRVTEGGHKTAQADPRGFSASRCRIETPPGK